MTISKDIRYVGVNDHQVDLFEGQYVVPNGMSYISYVILDEKVAVFDTVDRNFTEPWLENVRSVLDGRQPDYLIIQHMEPDHSANIANFLKVYPDTTDALDKVLFSADGFGKFGALDVQEDWDDEARRYYIGIVGKYGPQVQALLKKAAGLEISTICPLHGPVLTENLGHYLNLYNLWSSYQPEEKGVVVAYTSVYGNTKAAAELLAETLKDSGCSKVTVYDLARCDMAQAVADAFRYDKLVLATTTYNADIFPFMKEFIHHLTERNFQNRTVALVENGTWAPTAAKVMAKMLECSKNLTFCETSVKILSALSEESRAQIAALAKELCE